MPQGSPDRMSDLDRRRSESRRRRLGASPKCMRELGNRVCFPTSPEICVEVLSPSNTEAEIREKMALYFDAGAREVWLCAASGAVSFFGPGTAQPMSASEPCPQFPKQIDLR